MAEIFEGLQNLAIFEGQPEETRRRALLEAGLALMTPQKGGHPLASLQGGVSAGLTALDRETAKRAAAEQQQFTNRISQQKANAGTTQARAAAESVDVNRQQVSNTFEVERKKIEETMRQFDGETDVRKAKSVLDYAKARYWDRMPTQGGAGGRTAADNVASQHVAKMAAMYAEDQALPPLQQRFTGMEDPFLVDSAWAAITQRTEASGAEQLAYIAEGTGDAEGIGTRLQQIVDPELGYLRQEQPNPQDEARASEMLTWTPEQWKAVGQAGPEAQGEVRRLVAKYPFLIRRVNSLFRQAGAEPAAQ